MPDKNQFISELDSSYQFSGVAITLGAGMLDGEVQTNHLVKIPVKMMNRHGLIAGATGTGKTKSLQLIAEGLSAAGVPVLLMDIKGDLSGIAKPGTDNPKIQERVSKIGVTWNPQQFPVELLSLSNQPGVRLRATVTEFGPVLFSKILGLNDTQQSVMAIIFKYSDDKKLPLVDLQDLKALMQFMGDEGKEEVTKLYGNISPATISTILRKIIELEQQHADVFFGEPSFDPHDLLRTDLNGKGYISILRLTDIQDRPKMFSTFMLSLLAEIYGSFPEVGDPDKPKLVLFIDEAHLVFRESTKALLEQFESTIKLIRSKGVGIIFCTQNTLDIPAAFLSQLGIKIQHSLRAYTAIDRETIEQSVKNFPDSSYYKLSDLITEMGIGEALVTALNEKGVPTMLVHTMVCPPSSQMDILTDVEIRNIVIESQLELKYHDVVDRQTAFEILKNRIDPTNNAEDKTDTRQATQDAVTDSDKSGRLKKKDDKSEPTTFDKILRSPVVRSIGVAVAGAVTRKLLGSLGLKSRMTTRKKR